MERLQVRTPRLTLVSTSIPLLEAELNDPGRIGTLLGAAMPAAWPPEFFERDDMERCLDYARAAEPAWGLWYVVREGAPRAVVGVLGFGGAPKDGRVVIGYSIAPEFRRRGVASEAVGALVAWALSDARVNEVRAETFPNLTPSIGVLGKTGFVRVEGAETPGAIAFVKTRDATRAF
jgi:ribosomal-protein-alanine N-acetyltransferase